MNDGKAETSIPHDLRDLLQHLYFLGMLKTSQKPNFKTKTFANADSWFDTYIRMRDSEGKDLVALNIERITDQTINALKNHRGTEFVDILIGALKEAYTGKEEDETTGIQGLIETYKKYPDICARLRVCISNIELQIRTYEKPKVPASSPPPSVGSNQQPPPPPPAVPNQQPPPVGPNQPLPLAGLPSSPVPPPPPLQGRR